MQVSHAYLLNAPDRLAGLLTARKFAAYCIGEPELIFNTQHPDVAELPGFSAQGTLKDSVNVADIDALTEGVHKRPSRGDQKFYIINYAETLSPQSQNKLLKTLEEPPPCVRIILNCRFPLALLPTVRSRCREIGILPFTAAEIEAELTERYKDAGRASLAAALSRGSLTEADSLVNEPKRTALFKAVWEVLLNLKSSKDILDAAAALNAYKNGLFDILDFLELIFRDVLMLKSEVPELIALNGYMPELTALKESYSVAALEKILPFLGKIRKRVQLNANPNSVTDELLFYIAECRAKL